VTARLAFQSWEQNSQHKGLWERGFPCSSGARTSALQTPVVACLGAGNELNP